MFEVKMPREIREYKEKIALGLTVRQLICISLAIVICVPLYFFGRAYIPEEILSWLVILIGLALGAIGYFKKDGMPLEKYLAALLKFTFLYPQKRVYRSESLTERISEQEYQKKLERWAELNKKKGSK